MWPNPEFPADMVTFTEEILTGKCNFLFCDITISFNQNVENNRLIFSGIEKSGKADSG